MGIGDGSGVGKNCSVFVFSDLAQNGGWFGVRKEVFFRAFGELESEFRGHFVIWGSAAE